MPNPAVMDKELIETEIKPGQECYSLREAEIQEGSAKAGQTQRRVKSTLIAVGPGNKTDKAFYSQEAINTGPAFFEGARCFANHLSALDKQIQPERRIEQEIGYFTDVVVEGEKLTGILNIFDGDSLNQYWDRVKGAINYAKKYPGRNIFGLSIHAAGDAKPFAYQGDPGWKQVMRFADVKSCDFVTWPARNGEFTTILSESEQEETLAAGSDSTTVSNNIRAMMKNGVDQDQAVAVALKKAGKSYQSEADPQSGNIFQTLKNHVNGLTQAGAPGAEETRRIVDQLGTSLKLNKQEEGMDPVTQQPATDPTADVSDEALKAEAMKAGHLSCAETYKRQAETETEAGKKGLALKMAERHIKASEAFVHAAPGSSVHVAVPPAPANPAAPKPGTPEAEAAKRQAEEEAKRQAEAAAKPPIPASESEFKGKYNNLLIETLLGKSGLSKAKQDFCRTVVLENETDENRIRGKIGSYIRAELQEVNRGGHGAPRVDNPDFGGSKPELKNSRQGLKRILANAKGA